MPASILFIAPAQAVTRIFPQLKEEGFEAGLAETLKGALAFIRKVSPALVFSRPVMPGYRAQDLLAEASVSEAFPPVIVFTDKGSAEEAQAFLELGARDYWLEPLVWDKVRAVLPDAPPPRPAAKKKHDALEIIGRHPAVTRILALAKQVAKSKATVLVQGGSGTGKELVARYLHAMSDRSQGPFVAINCAALPEHLLESELFGHEKGSFTGAINRKLGKFELATGGTILLDEITEMDMGLQAKLLRVLQEGEIDRVGGVEVVRVDVRVLATTNRDIEESVRNGKFRQDLFYRLNVIPLKLPALKARGDDVLLLADFFVAKFCAAYSLGRLAFTEDSKQWLLNYEWPGNVRELQNLMERAVLLCGNGPIQKQHFLVDSDTWTPNEEQALAAGDLASDAILPDTMDEALSVMPLHEMEKRLILKSLDETSGNRTQAADLLGISVRTLRNKINEYKTLGLDVP